MYYNLELFGQKLRKIRQDLNYSQKDITLKTGIEERTIRRIEYGQVLPKLDTLEILSLVYKVDLISCLLECRFDDYTAFCELKNNIEAKLDSGDQNTLHNEFEALNFLLSSVKNLYYKNLINQLILFTESAILYKDNNDNNTALHKLIEAIKITTPAFILDNYDSFVYSSMEIRILMNIAFIFNRLNDKEKYLEIIEFCINSIDTDDEIYPKLCHNLAGAYIRQKKFQKALDYSIMGIEACQINRNFIGLNLLYYGKGIAEYRLNKEQHMESLTFSIYLSKSFGQDSLEKTIIDNCKEFLNIDLNI